MLVAMKLMSAITSSLLLPLPPSCKSLSRLPQAIARSHRIGQTKEVRVIHLEAISDPVDENRVGVGGREQVGLVDGTFASRTHRPFPSSTPLSAVPYI